MEAGVSYNKQRLHKAGYFRELLATNPDIDEGLGSLLRLCRETVVRPGEDRECFGALAGARRAVGGPCGAINEHPRRGADHGVDLGPGGRGRAAILFVQKRARARPYSARRCPSRATNIYRRP